MQRQRIVNAGSGEGFKVARLRCVRLKMTRVKRLYRVRASSTWFAIHRVRFWTAR